MLRMIKSTERYARSLNNDAESSIFDLQFRSRSERMRWMESADAEGNSAARQTWRFQSTQLTQAKVINPASGY